MKARTIVLPIIGTVIALSAVAQDGSNAASKPQSSPEMKRLAKMLSGDWSISIKVEPGEGVPYGGKGKGEEAWKPGPGGFSLIEDYHSTGDEGEISGLGMVWWDDSERRFQVVWCDSTNAASCTVMNHGAKWEGDQLVAVNEWQRGGSKFMFKEIFSAITENSFTQTLYEGESSRELKKLVTITATRKIVGGN